jgi:hypothetical protein
MNLQNIISSIAAFAEKTPGRVGEEPGIRLSQEMP